MKRIQKHIPTDKNIQYCSMNKQLVEGTQKGKKTYMKFVDSKMVIAILALLFNGRVKEDISTFQRTKAKENENGFLGLSYDYPRAFPFSNYNRDYFGLSKVT